MLSSWSLRFCLTQTLFSSVFIVFSAMITPPVRSAPISGLGSSGPISGSAGPESAAASTFHRPPLLPPRLSSLPNLGLADLRASGRRGDAPVVEASVVDAPFVRRDGSDTQVPKPLGLGPGPEARRRISSWQTTSRVLPSAPPPLREGLGRLGLSNPRLQGQPPYIWDGNYRLMQTSPF